MKCVISSPVLGIAVQINRFRWNYKVALHLLAGAKCVGKQMQRRSRARCVKETSLAAKKECRRLHLSRYCRPKLWRSLLSQNVIALNLFFPFIPPVMYSILSYFFLVIWPS